MLNLTDDGSFGWAAALGRPSRVAGRGVAVGPSGTDSVVGSFSGAADVTMANRMVNRVSLTPAGTGP